jgi:predicted chitinase
MLISYPLLPGRTNTAGKPETDSAYEIRLLSYEDNSFAKEHELFDEGVYPVSFDGRWHGGIHMKPATNTEPIRAIADGEVVAYRYADKPLFTHDDAQKTRDCDNSFVLLKHKTETGEGVVVEYYSLYMHLANAESNTKQLPAGAAFNQKNNSADFMRKATAASADSKAIVPAAADKKVYRKQILGYAGQMYGERMFHFEVFTDEAKLNAFFKDSKTEYVDANKDGTKELWGDVYFVIPEKTKHLKQPDIADAAVKAKYTTRTDGENEKKLYVGWHYAKGQRKMTVWEDGNPEPIAENIVVPSETDYEYELFELAEKRFDASVGAGYELLRWGRMLGPDKDKLNTAALKANWQPMPYKVAANVPSWGYINLSDSKILKLSDADFPHWLGWRKVASATKADGTVDITKLQEIFKEIDTNDDKNLSKEEFAAWLQDAKAKRKFKHLVVQSPSEWDKTHNEARYGGLKAAGKVFDPAKDVGGKNYDEFKKFIEKFQWWAESGLANSANFWHFHPIQFIQQFKRCGWFDKNELAQMLPRKHGPTATSLASIGWSVSTARFANYFLDLNKTFRKYGITDAVRQTHFLAQTYIETAMWRTMTEIGKAKQQKKKDGTLYWPAAMMEYYGAFYGRGIMQLTWAGNYESYGKYRKFADVSATYAYKDNRLSQSSTHYWEDPYDKNKKFVGVPKIWATKFEPDDIVDDTYKACDSGGHYWISKNTGSKKLNINRVCDDGITAEKIGRTSVLVNGGGYGFAERQAYAAYIERYLTDTAQAEASKSFTVTYGNKTKKTYTIYVDFTPQRP